MEKNLFICHHCDHHFRVKPSFYKDLLLDKGTAKQHFERLRSVDFLEFKINKSYENQLLQAREKTGDADAIKVYVGEMNQISIVLGVMNFHFIGGSMGSVIGEIVSRSIKLSEEKNLPFLLICCSGGARMQEGAISLMQLAKTTSQLAKFSTMVDYIYQY